MKRSRAVTLTIMSTITMAACGDDVPPPAPSTYATVQECVAGGNPQDVCLKTFEDAVATHNQTAPAFPDKDTCERGVDVDSCVPAQRRQPDGSLSNVFVPAMAGYILGNALANRGGGGSYGSGPVYRSRDYPTAYRDRGDLVTSRAPPGTPGLGAPSRVPTLAPGASRPPTLAPGPTRPPNVGTTTISRGGFGASGSSFGGGGSS